MESRTAQVDVVSISGMCKERTPYLKFRRKRIETGDQQQISELVKIEGGTSFLFLPETFRTIELLKRKSTARVLTHEENIPTARSEAKEHARISCPDGDKKRQESLEPSTREGPPQTLCERRALDPEPSSVIPLRFTLSKSEILRGYQSFSRVITSGNSINVHPIRCYYIRSEGQPPTILAGFSVSRNIRSAVDRNRAKRLMRESYRLNKSRLARGSETNPPSLAVVFMYTASAPMAKGRVSFEAVNDAMKKLIKRLSEGK
jgi:ribonuclease P protein component